MTPGDIANFKKEKVCHDCGKPCTKSRCVRCLFIHNTAAKIRNAKKEILQKKQGRPKIKQVSDRRRSETTRYGELRKAFLLKFPTCPVSGELTTQVHHSAHREGSWLNLVYYWIAVSQVGHRIIEDNPEWAFANNLRVKVNALYDHHAQCLVNDGEDLNDPIFYRYWTGKLIPPP